MLTITQPAANRVQDFLTTRGKGIGLRVGVKTMGCSGMAYTLEFVDTLNENDLTFISNGITLITDEKSLLYINGTELDYTKEGLNEGFKFINPLEASSCGCGESFTV